MQRLKWLTLMIVFVFCLPLALQYLPQPTKQQPEKQLVYASQNTEAKKDILVLYTHSHEAYVPIVKEATGKAAYYDDKLNIATLTEPLTAAFSSRQLAVHTMETDVMKTMKLSHSKFHEAYKVARPFIQEAIQKRPYDLILDIHRDSAKKKVTTLTSGDKKYAKIALVIGLEHPTYGWNLAYAEQLNAELNQLVPGISRGIMKKEGKGVDGVYNQDLAQQLLLVEIGGIDNTEQELLNTIEVLAEAVQSLLGHSLEQTEVAKQSI